MAGTYNEVQARKLGSKNRRGQKIMRDESKTPNSTNAPEQQASWPPSLQEFVNKSFQQAETLNDAQKGLFNQQIQSLIYSAARENKIWTNDWASQKLPVFVPSAPLALVQDTQPPVPRLRDPLIENTSYSSKQRKKQRAERFSSSLSPAQYTPPPAGSTEQITGTSTAMEKRYLRLTSEPDPAAVRPEAVLRKCLDFVVNKFKTTASSYSYINDQLKAIRQDLTVQHIKNDLAIQVYETHGRIAIENDDLGEFNQCQSQLSQLYKAAILSDPKFYVQTYEFTCYRTLYLLLTGNHSSVISLRMEVMDFDAGVEESVDKFSVETHRECLYKALSLLPVLTLNNYNTFFQIYKWFKNLSIPSCAFHLLDKFMAPKQRLLALNTMSKAFKKLPTEYVCGKLAIDSSSAFFKEYGLSAFVNDSSFDLASAKSTLQAIVDRGTFKKVDIKGQV